ncbi:Sb-PDE family phosphodiesterase [Flavobacteriaceae bacterium]|nr:Sb-PDE family phosphodiesterase [Flavobacteriaceae bacterium]
MKKTISTLILVLIVFNINSQSRKEFFKSPKEIFYISSDLHIHSVFSDGSVWPTIRVDEAIRDSIDLISLTEHLEYQSHISDIPHTNRNRSFQIAGGYIQKKPLAVVHGTEITKPMPPGHFNAIFIKDANKFFDKNKEPLSFINGIKEANNQGAFVFWNHPMWEANRSDGIAKLDPIHKEVINKKLLHGIEVVNFDTFSEEAMQIALDNELTMMGTSDVHVLIDWDFNKKEESFHRPITFIMSKNRTIKSIRDALFNGDTFIWYRDLIIGRSNNLKQVIQNNLKVISKGYGFKGRKVEILQVELINKSVAPISLNYIGKYTFHNDYKFIELKPRSSKTIYVKTKKIEETVSLEFEILNYVIAPKTNLKTIKTINID